MGVPAQRPRRCARRLRRPRLRRQRLGPAAGAVALAAARLRRPGVHERALPVPGRPALRARREPDGRLPARVRRAGRVQRAGGAALRGRRLVLSRVAQRRVPGDVAREPAAVGVRRWRRAAAGRRQRARGARAPVVLRVLPRGPGHVVAVGDLPRRDAALAPGDGRDRRRLRPCRLRPRDRRRAAAGRRAGRRRARDGAGARDRGARGRDRDRRAGRGVERRDAAALRLRGGERGRAGDAADRLPARGDRGRAAAGQRASRPAARRQPPRVRPGRGTRR